MNVGFARADELRYALVGMRSDGTILKAEDVALGYGRATVLRAVALQVTRGDFWFLLGPNGAGKTTFLRSLLGLVETRAGRLERASDLTLQRIGFVPQRCNMNPSLPTTVREFVTLGLVGLSVNGKEAKERLEEALTAMALGGMESRDYWSLSGGMRQRALLARALVRRPILLLLDEPTSGLDPTTEESLLRCLVRLNADQRLTMLFVTHDLSLAMRYATHAALFHDGAVVAGTREAVLTPENLQRVYGMDLGTARMALESPPLPVLGGHV
jgi:zinc transport system ATP-binding protein